MNKEILDNVIKVAACVCGKDGVISQIEEECIYNTIRSQNPSYSIERFNQVIDEFFNETYQLEYYLEIISEINIKEFTIHLCEVSASADGLDIKENIALNKVKLILDKSL